MFDLIFIFSAIGIVLFAFMRGFIKEIFALLTIIFTTFATFLLFPFLSKFVFEYSKNIEISNIISATIIFIFAYIGFILSTRKLSSHLDNKLSSSTSQILAVIYSIPKTLIFFGIVYAITTNLYVIIVGKNISDKSKKDSMPVWLYEAKTRFIIEPFGIFVDPIVKSSINKIKKDFISKNNPQTLDDKIEDIVVEDSEELKTDTEKDKNLSTTKIDESKIDAKEKGYSKKEIEKMNRLIEIVQ